MWTVDIHPLAMVDDLLTLSECGVDSVKMNGYPDAQTNFKKLQFGGDKCHTIHIGKKKHICVLTLCGNCEKRNQEYERYFC